jgi:hypothetical protein
LKEPGNGKSHPYHLGCDIALLDGIIEPVPHLGDRAVGLDVSAARLQPQR